MHKFAHDSPLLLLNLLHLDLELGVVVLQRVNFLLECVRKFNELLFLAKVKLVGVVGLVLTLANLFLELHALFTVEHLLIHFQFHLLFNLLVFLVEVENLHSEQSLLVLLFFDKLHELFDLVLDCKICAGILLYFLV